MKERVHELYGPEFLLERPLLRAIREGRAAVLLIDELDRSDDEFEAFLLEVLSDFTVTVPELGTIHTDEPPAVMITSNRTRELHDALKRRCLYHWIDFPDLEREIEIIKLRVPGVSEQLARAVATAVARLRGLDLIKPPGAAEAIDWAQALAILGADGCRRRGGSRDARLGHQEPRRPAARRGGSARALVVSGRSDVGVERLVAFGRALRDEGLSVGTGRINDFCRAASLVPPGDLYWAGRGTLVAKHDDIPVYDRVFRAFFGEDVPAPPEVERPQVTVSTAGSESQGGRRVARRRSRSSCSQAPSRS